MKMTNMTALEWFLRHVNIGGVKQGHGLNIDEVKEQALELEKQQIIDAFQYKFLHPYVENEPEQYYNQTYKPSNQQ